MCNYNNELYHYGVLGMKWGVRKKGNPSKRQVKRAIRKSPKLNLRKVEEEHGKSLTSNKKYRSLGEESNRIAKKIIKFEEESAFKNTFDLTDEVRMLYKRHAEIDKQMQKIEIKTGKEHIEKYNDARIKDIEYTGPIERGREMLKQYGKDYKINGYGNISSGYFDMVDPLTKDDYIRPHNL